MREKQRQRKRVVVVILENCITIAKSHQMKNIRASGRRKKNVIFPGAKATNVFRLFARLPIVLKTLPLFSPLFSSLKKKEKKRVLKL